MQIIKHRVNQIADLEKLGVELGAEIDIRTVSTLPHSFVLTHDPWTAGDSLETWLELFKERDCKGPIIFNTKEDGLELEIMKLAEKIGIKNYFFLDTCYPTLVKWAQIEQKDCFAGRVSKYETCWEQYLKLDVIPKWLWMDCFQGECLPEKIFEDASEHFKLCLVSPELQGVPLDTNQDAFQRITKYCSAICTKKPEYWMEVEP